MMKPTVLVVGVGRTGTTNTARILHNHYGICMGHSFAEPHPPLPDGGYEHHPMIPWSKKLSELPGFEVKTWLERYSTVHNACAFKYPHGIKQTALALCRAKQYQELSPKLIVRTYRPIGPTTKSLKRWRGQTMEHWVNFYLNREAMMDASLGLVKHTISIAYIDYSEQRDDKYITDILDPYVRSLYE